LSQDVRKKAQFIQKQNTAPHVLSRGGYDFLEQKVNGEKQKNDWSKQPNPEALKQLLIIHLPSDNT